MRSLVQGYVPLRSSTTFEAVARLARISVKLARKHLLRRLRGKENCICRTLMNYACDKSVLNILHKNFWTVYIMCQSGTFIL